MRRLWTERGPPWLSVGRRRSYFRREKELKILIADDHEVVRAGLAQWLKNWTIYEAVDAAEVLKLYRKHKPNVVVLEARLPGDGLECLGEA
jgi:DNA-binding NarL/FixJ family response regulator